MLACEPELLNDLRWLFHELTSLSSRIILAVGSSLTMALQTICLALLAYRSVLRVQLISYMCSLQTGSPNSSTVG